MEVEITLPIWMMMSCVLDVVPNSRNVRYMVREVDHFFVLLVSDIFPRIQFGP